MVKNAEEGGGTWLYSEELFLVTYVENSVAAGYPPYKGAPGQQPVDILLKRSNQACRLRMALMRGDTEHGLHERAKRTLAAHYRRPTPGSSSSETPPATNSEGSAVSMENTNTATKREADRTGVANRGPDAASQPGGIRAVTRGSTNTPASEVPGNSASAGGALADVDESEAQSRRDSGMEVEEEMADAARALMSLSGTVPPERDLAIEKAKAWLAKQQGDSK